MIGMCVCKFSFFSAIRVWDTRYIWGRSVVAASVEQIDPPKRDGSARSRAFTNLTLDSSGTRVFATCADNR